MTAVLPAALAVDEAVLEAVHADLLRRRETVATAESLTAGLLAAVLTDLAGASAVVRGGLVVYATDLKAELAGVDPELLGRHGAVHPEIARALANGARRVCQASWGIGLTGVAGPDPQDGVPPGTVHIGLVGPVVDRVRSACHPGERHEVRCAAVRSALALLREALSG